MRPPKCSGEDQIPFMMAIFKVCGAAEVRAFALRDLIRPLTMRLPGGHTGRSLRYIKLTNVKILFPDSNFAEVPRPS